MCSNEIFFFKKKKTSILKSSLKETNKQEREREQSIFCAMAVSSTTQFRYFASISFPSIFHPFSSFNYEFTIAFLSS